MKNLRSRILDKGLNSPRQIKEAARFLAFVLGLLAGVVVNFPFF